jgi:hypothetical protein
MTLFAQNFKNWPNCFTLGNSLGIKSSQNKHLHLEGGYFKNFSFLGLYPRCLINCIKLNYHNLLPWECLHEQK